MSRTIEDIFTKADFTSGSNHKVILKDRLFISNKGGNTIPFPLGRELTEDELDMVSAAGFFEDYYKKDKDNDEQ